MLKKLKKDIKKLAKYKEGKKESRYSKTGPGDYAEGQIFLGIKTPIKRELAKKYASLSFGDISRLMKENIHDYRFIGLIILSHKYKKDKNKKNIIEFYINNTDKINNWSLVDISAYQILGNFLLDKPKDILYEFANSEDLWKKRIAIVSTYAFIRENQFQDTLNIAEILLGDKHDLIHKANGWMLREVGKKDLKVLESFLRKHYNKLPRTTLRYAIERFPEEKRKMWLKGEFI